MIDGLCVDDLVFGVVSFLELFFHFLEDLNGVVHVFFLMHGRRNQTKHDGVLWNHGVNHHGAENAMIFAKRDLSGCTVYVTHPPCPRCASKLVQEEVRRVVFISPSEDFLSRWSDDLKLSYQMYEEAGIEHVAYNLEDINIENAGVTIAPGGFFRKVLNRLLG